MFGHSAWMLRHGCFIDTGDLQSGLGDVADSQADGEGEDSLENDPEGEPGESSDDPNQKRTSKQPPEVDAAFAEARRARKEAEELRAENAKIKGVYVKYGLHTADDIVAAVTLQEQKLASANQDEDAKFASYLASEKQKLKAANWDDLAVETHMTALKADYRAYKAERRLAQSEEVRRVEKEQEKKQQQVDKGFSGWYDQFKDLRKEYPDLLPKKASNFNDVIATYPKVIECMTKENLSFKHAFKEVFEDEIADRRVQRKNQKTQDNDSRSTTSGKDKGSATGGTHGLTDQQQKLAKAGGMTNKEYAALLKHVKK